MPGYATDELNATAIYMALPHQRRIGWLCYAKPNSKNINTWSGSEQSLNQVTT